MNYALVHVSDGQISYNEGNFSQVTHNINASDSSGDMKQELIITQERYSQLMTLLKNNVYVQTYSISSDNVVGQVTVCLQTLALLPQIMFSLEMSQGIQNCHIQANEFLIQVLVIRFVII